MGLRVYRGLGLRVGVALWLRSSSERALGAVGFRVQILAGFGFFPTSSEVFEGA